MGRINLATPRGLASSTAHRLKFDLKVPSVWRFRLRGKPPCPDPDFKANGGSFVPFWPLKGAPIRFLFAQAESDFQSHHGRTP